jgi:UrcA family protein
MRVDVPGAMAHRVEALTNWGWKMRAILISAAFGGLAIAAVGTAAAADQKLQQVRVEATRIVTTDVGKSYSGVPVTNIALSYEVSLDDLDLSTYEGVAAAEKRINTAAAQACKELGSNHPNATPADAQCAKQAAHPALAKLHQAAATKKAPAK